MDVRQLEYFLAVVDHGGFNKAAAALYLSQPSLSQAIRALERDLGSELFHRIGRRVVLTEAGQALIEPARGAARSLELARARVEAVHELRSGRVDIAAMPSQAVEPLTGMIRRFSASHPQLSMVVRAAFTPPDVIDMVRTGRCELGLVASPDAVDAANVEVHDLGRQRFVLLAARDGPFRGRRAVRSEQLAGQRLIVGQHGTGMRRYVDDLRTRGCDVTLAVETEHRVAILPLVLEGVGVAVVTEAWRGLAERAGALVLELEPEDGLRISLISRRAALTPAAAAFLDEVTRDRAAGDQTARDQAPRDRDRR
ncbi:LysR family transcriptional regulator [Streptomyces armeniacus]|uniref:LysR family transcriptional regulator n=1 Tax=Streptomyces armeniacus TaxID=83291 RepID=A0A345XJ57_9ACTN|nr:LysR family transcriptional regulator [Streptomyces armeniacus]AXK31673.1 LysR family transcriptional regulator [Streptomyces armeniacus]